MSFLYPRVIEIHRRKLATTVGATDYSADQYEDGDEDVILTGLLASIQLDRQGQRPTADLPTDSRQAVWKVFVPLQAATPGSITENDVVVDDLGKRYQVFAAWWDSLGYQLRATLLEV